MDKASKITTLTARRPKWHYPSAPPTPRILHLPRRPRRRPQAKANAPKPSRQKDNKGKLETLFDQEREFIRGMPVIMVSDHCGEERRERVEERDNVEVEEEKWRFQAEMLRAECNLLRMERVIAVKKMERRRSQVEKALRSALQTLLSGTKTLFEGKNASIVLEEEIAESVEKLEKLQRRTRSRIKDLQVREGRNFDKQAIHLQRRLKKFSNGSDDKYAEEIQEMAEASLSLQNTNSASENFASNHTCNMEILRRKMEELSKGTLLEKMEVEYGSMLSTVKRVELLDMSSTSTRHLHKEQRPCSGGCKEIVRRVVEQVRAETEQWSQMQEMLGQVRNEMEELQASRDFWEHRALDSDKQIQILQTNVKEWKTRATCSEEKVSELEAQLSMVCVELEGLKKEKAQARSSRIRNVGLSSSNSQELPNEMEKRVLVCRLKENHHHHHHNGGKDDGFRQTTGRKMTNVSGGGLGGDVKRSPLGEIGNGNSHLRY